MKWMRPVIAAAATVIAVLSAVPAETVTAQGSVRPVLGIGPFLTKDRGWNYERNLAALVGFEVPLGTGQLRLALTGRIGARGNLSYVSQWPPRPGSTENGVTLAVHARTPPGPAGVYLVVGPEIFRAIGERGPLPARGSRVAVAGGIGIGGARWSLESRYAVFQRAIGTTRGHLDLAVLRRL